MDCSWVLSVIAFCRKIDYYMSDIHLGYEKERIKNNRLSDEINGRNFSVVRIFKKFIQNLFTTEKNFMIYPLPPLKNSSISTTQTKSKTYDEKLSAIDTLFYNSQNYESSKEYLETMKFIIKLKNLAPFNAWLLRQQNPDVTYVATIDHWNKEYNRTIKPKARAYVIMKAFGPVDFVFDIKDTVGEPLPIDLQASFRADGYLSDNTIETILKCCHKKNIKVSFDNTLHDRQAGWASHNRLSQSTGIVLNAEHKKEVQFSTLVHELAHLMLGHCGQFIDCECEDRRNLTVNAMEVEAETVSWLICDRLSIKTDAEKYLNSHINKKDVLGEISIHKILTTADRIEAIIVSGFCKVKKTKSK